jgi:lipid-binding SYLF domain-containing protein
LLTDLFFSYLEELHFCSGLAFTSITKAGAGLSFAHGRGFVIAKLPSDKATTSTPQQQYQQRSSQIVPWTWSAPLFINVNAGGVGLTLGYAEIDSITILDTPEAVASFKNSVVELDTDVTAAAGASAGTSLPATAVNISHTELSDREFTYSLAQGGVLVDVSLNGVAYTVDNARNEAMYGIMTSPAAILEGGVHPPAVMSELYGAIDSAMKEFYLE